jgi:hypothetical protein
VSMASGYYDGKGKGGNAKGKDDDGKGKGDAMVRARGIRWMARA